MSINSAGDAGLAGAQQGAQEVANFGQQAQAWGNNMMNQIQGDVFGPSASSGSGSGLGSDGFGGSNSGNALQQIELQLVELLLELMQLGNAGAAGSGTPNAGTGGSSDTGSNASPETFYQNASGHSTGDPHLAFNGSSNDGQTSQSGTQDNMRSQSDLFDANGSVRGGYQVSTHVGPEYFNAGFDGGKNVAVNNDATITTNHGRDTVSLNGDGQVSIMQDGNALSINKGQTLHLGGGVSVTENQDGSVTESAETGTGNVSTTLSQNGGHGVDVSFTSQNMDVGGYLASLGEDSSQQPQYIG